MSFDSIAFLFIFLPFVLIAYFAANGVEQTILCNGTHLRPAQRNITAGRNAVLLIASLFFYAWGEPAYVLLLVASSFLAWTGGLLIERWRGRLSGRIITTLVILLLLSSLGTYKYLGFLIENINKVPCIELPLIELRLPIGISFFTFQILSYIIDLQRGTISVQRNPLQLLLYVCLFPQLIAGPIVRYSTIEQELSNRKTNAIDIYEGTLRFIQGLTKKIILADNIARFSDAVYDIHINSQTDPNIPCCVGTTVLWVAALAYTLQLYFDFSGYSDMAIGLGRIFGFHFLENFNYPYISRSVTEFWRRWHMSLSGWFRDYVYIPMGGNRLGIYRQILNILIVWMLTGLWHGAAWNFILWGLYYGLLLMVEKLWRMSSLRKVIHHTFNLPYLEEMSTAKFKFFERTYTGIHWLLTFFIVNIGWVLFHISDMKDLSHILHPMFCWQATDWILLIATHSDVYLAWIYIPIGLLLSFPIFKLDSNNSNVTLQVLRPILATVSLILCIVYIFSSSFHPFIYFRF